jgi:PAS domain S-box-containing protein
MDPEKALRENEDRLRQLAEHIDAVFWITDLETRQVLYLSPAIERLWGFDRAAFYRDPGLWAASVHPDDRGRAEAAFVERARQHAFDETYRMVTPARGIRWIRDRGFPIADAGGRIYRLGGIAEDITERVEAETELREARAAERRAHADLKASFDQMEAAKRDLEQANRAKDEFLAMLGHELRNPLGAIRSAIGVLDARAGDGAAREVIRRQADHLARLVDDLLDVSRVTRGQVTLRRQPLELAGAVARAVSMLGATGLTRLHRVSVAPAAPVWVEADPARLEQIVSNLVGNAVKYTPDGGEIRVSVESDRAQARLVVRDTGEGIPASALPRVFDLFYQVRADPSDRRRGLGIGLTLVRHLAQLHGGTVKAASGGIGAGSVFTVTLPRTEPPATTPPPPEKRAAPTTRRVLVVEDGEDAREMLRMVLTLTGHQVWDAADGRAALAILARERMDVAVVDIGLPGLSGYELAEAIRARPDGHRIFLVALTGFGRPADQRRALEAGFDAHLVKPVDPERLGALIDGSPPR